VILDSIPAPRAFLIELANGSYGYLAPPNQVELGGYETWPGTKAIRKALVGGVGEGNTGEARGTSGGGVRSVRSMEWH